MLQPFDPQQVAFGRHETFPIRYGWLSKGFQAVTANSKIFTDDKATVVLGVGKNMVSAIHYWLQASRLIELNEDWEPTPLGRSLFSVGGWDPYLEDEATLWLIHWLLSSTPDKATGIFWFFNRFHKTQFTEAEVFAALKSFVSTQVDSKRSDSTLKIDVNVILRMYAPSVREKGALSEEALDSPLANLNLLRRGEEKTFAAASEARTVPSAVLAFAIAELFHTRRSDSALNLRDLVHSDGYWPAPGAVFRLNEAHLLNLLEEVSTFWPHLYGLRETAGIHQIYRIPQKLDALSPLQFLEEHYKTQENAA